MNIRHVFKIDWSLLWPYTNPETPETHESLQFDRVSRVRLLAKAKALIQYEPGPQFESDAESIQDANQNREMIGVEAEAVSMSRVMSSATNSPSQSDFQISEIEYGRIPRSRLKAPPDPEFKLPRMLLIPESLRKPIDGMLERVQLPEKTTPGNPFIVSLDPNIIAGSMNRMWRDAKGVTAVIIASI